MEIFFFCYIHFVFLFRVPQPQGDKPLMKYRRRLFHPPGPSSGKESQWKKKKEFPGKREAVECFNICMLCVLCKRLGQMNKLLKTPTVIASPRDKLQAARALEAHLPYPPIPFAHGYFFSMFRLRAQIPIGSWPANWLNKSSFGWVAIG